MTPQSWPKNVRTLAIDIGGSGFKGAILDAKGEMLTERVRVDTPYPCPPEKLVDSLVELTQDLGERHRVSVGFPGLVRNGKVRNIPSLSRETYDGDTDPRLEGMWRGFDLAGALQHAFSVPVKVANDADVQGCGVVTGEGYEFVMTLGTGVGTALFLDGRLIPHVDAGHAPFRKGQTFEEQLGNVVRKEVGNDRWRRRVAKALLAYDRFLFYDTVYVGGGNAKHLHLEDLSRKAVIVPNTAGITGGVRLWELDA
ncbi:MAG TPA: ROK family protein [Candidatus Nanopelagicales bacterium]|nr:ROK family protein [Candidatus Nanopelagicales bacterium]